MFVKLLAIWAPLLKIRLAVHAAREAGPAAPDADATRARHRQSSRRSGMIGSLAGAAALALPRRRRSGAPGFARAISGFAAARRRTTWLLLPRGGQQRRPSRPRRRLRGRALRVSL